MALTKSEGKAIGEAIAAQLAATALQITSAVAKRMQELADQQSARFVHLEARVLEAEQAQSKALRWHGLWTGDGSVYTPGALVQLKGSMWICQRDTNARPGSNDDWKLCVKGGER